MSDQNSTTPDPNEAVPGYQPPASAEPAEPVSPAYEPPAYEPPAAPGGYTPPAAPGGYTPPAAPQQPAAGGYVPPASGGGYTPPASPGGYTPPAAPEPTPAAGAYGQPPVSGYPEPSGYPPANPYEQQPGAYPPGGFPVPSAPVGGAPLVDWSKRALGGLIDYVAAGLVIGVVGSIVGAINTNLGGVVNSVLYLAWMVYLGYKSGTTGVTFGRSIAKTKLISEETGQPIGVTNGVIRQFAHIIDTIICYIGWLFPLWDAKRQTIADKVMKTVVIDNSADPDAGKYNWNL